MLVHISLRCSKTCLLITFKICRRTIRLDEKKNNELSASVECEHPRICLKKPNASMQQQ